MEFKVDTRAAPCYSKCAEIQMIFYSMAAKFLHATELLDFAVCQYTALSYVIEMLLACREALAFFTSRKVRKCTFSWVRQIYDIMINNNNNYPVQACVALLPYNAKFSAISYPVQNVLFVYVYGWGNVC